MNERSRDIRENRLDPDDAPELMDELFAHGEWRIGDRIVSRNEGETEVRRKLRGRPPRETGKTPIPICLSPEVKSSGQRQIIQDCSKRGPRGQKHGR